METNMPPEVSARTGTAGGTLLVLLLQLKAEELLKTAVLAAVGAIVSFCVSLGLRWLMKRMRRRADFH